MIKTSLEVSFCIIGTNFISDKFVEACRLCEGVNVAAIFSRKEETGRAFADKHGIPKVFTDFDSMLSSPAFNSVYVASPTFCHSEQSIKALRAGKHVLCEKMITVDHSEFELTVKAAEESRTVLVEAMRQDFDPSIELIRNYVKKLGKLRRATLEYCQYSSRYDKFKSGTVLNAFDPALKNSALADIGIYPLHTCLDLFGMPLSVKSTSVFLSNGFEGAGSAILSYPEMTATVVYSKITDSVNPSVIEGELGSVTFDKINSPSKIIYHPRIGKAETVSYTPVDNNMIYEISAFCRMVRGECDSRRYLSVSDGTMRCVDMIYKSSGITFPSRCE